MKLASSPYQDSSIKDYPFTSLFNSVIDPVQTGSIKGCDALVLWGGVDIHPSFYKQKAHPFNETQSSFVSHRDWVEWQLLHDAKSYGIPVIGVCRGAQMLCAFAGGSLIQHVTNHRNGHTILTKDNKSIFANASHHQMMNVDGVEHDLLAWINSDPSTQYEGESAKKVERQNPLIDPEVVYFPEIQGLAIQPHPEWHSTQDPFVKWCLSQVEEYLYSEV